MQQSIASRVRSVPPPGLCVSDPETATQSRERRRVALVCKELTADISDIMNAKTGVVTGEIDELKAQIMHVGKNMELLLSGMSLLLGSDWPHRIVKTHKYASGVNTAEEAHGF